MANRLFNQVRCYKYRIYQRTKAIHNSEAGLNPNLVVLQIQDISKNESNSQQIKGAGSVSAGCYKYRIYQRTKAIHNTEAGENKRGEGATNIGYIKERKQFTTTFDVLPFRAWCYKYRIYQRTKAIHNIRVIEATLRLVLQIQDISKNESNSQLMKQVIYQMDGCYKYRIYQRTKAIHNKSLWHCTG